MTEIPSILTTLNNGIQIIKFNRCKKKNALTVAMYKEITTILSDSSKNNDVNMVVFTGEGKYFSSGNDLSTFLQFEELSQSQITNSVMSFKHFIDSLITFPKLLVAVVNGPAIGIATTMLGLCDMVYASDKASFQMPFTAIGLTAEGCSTYTFPKLMGSKAGDMLYMGYKMDAMEAKRYCLVSEVYKHEQLEEVWKYLYKVSRLSMEAIITTKRLVRSWDTDILLKINEKESNELFTFFESSERLEKMLKFISKMNKL